MTTTAIAAKKPEEAKAGTIAYTKNLLLKAQPTIAEVLPRHMSAERVVRMAIFACNQTPGLLTCSTNLLLAEVIRGAALGLDVGGVSGAAYIVPYKEKGVAKPKLVVGYKGYVELALRTGTVSLVRSRLVYEGDHFDYDYGINERLEHKPGPQSGDGWDKVTHAYAFVKFKDGTTTFEVLTRTQIEKRRGQAAAQGDRSPWNTHPEAMARKTAIRALAPALPQSAEIAAALELENRDELGHATGHSELLDSLPVIDVEAQEVAAPVSTPKATSFASKVAGQRAANQQAPATPIDIKATAVGGSTVTPPKDDAAIFSAPPAPAQEHAPEMSPEEMAEIAEAERQREPGEEG